MVLHHLLLHPHFFYTYSYHWVILRQFLISYFICKYFSVYPWVGKISWRRKWQPTLVLLPGKFHGGRSLVGYSLWDSKELDVTERLHLTIHCFIHKYYKLQ